MAPLNLNCSTTAALLSGQSSHGQTLSWHQQRPPYSSAQHKGARYMTLCDGSLITLPPLLLVMRGVIGSSTQLCSDSGLLVCGHRSTVQGK